MRAPEFGEGSHRKSVPEPMDIEFFVFTLHSFRWWTSYETLVDVERWCTLFLLYFFSFYLLEMVVLLLDIIPEILRRGFKSPGTFELFLR